MVSQRRYLNITLACSHNVSILSEWDLCVISSMSSQCSHNHASISCRYWISVDTMQSYLTYNDPKWISIFCHHYLSDASTYPLYWSKQQLSVMLVMFQHCLRSTAISFWTVWLHVTVFIISWDLNIFRAVLQRYLTSLSISSPYGLSVTLTSCLRCLISISATPQLLSATSSRTAQYELWSYS